MNIGETKNPMPSLAKLIEGWQFRLIEISPNHYRIEGNDEWGHSISRNCSEFEIKETLEKCANDARDIQKQIQVNK